MHTIGLLVAAALVVVGCGSSGDDSEAFIATLSHTFPPIHVEVGEESLGLCQSWRLNNDEPLYVSKVRQTNEGAWHHSNWFFVPEDMYLPREGIEGPDATFEGTWNCSDRDFREFLAAAAGGVFFAQSTQAFLETQVFPEGAVLEVPPRSAIVGDIHLVNVAARPLDSPITFEVEAIDEEDVEVKLRPISFSNGSLAIAPQAESRFSMTCDIAPAFRNAADMEPEYNIYYVLAHYHQWGNFFNLSFVDEGGGTRTIMELSTRVGEPIGKTIDPPIYSNGAPGLKVDCGYLNDTDRTLVYGFQDEEMCVFLAYTDAPLKIGIGSGENHPMGEDENGILLNETDCGSVVAFPATD
jgi:hypothetical protein